MAKKRYMSYLTFVNCYHSDTFAAAIRLGGVPVKQGHYDIVIPSRNATQVIEGIASFPSSSLTIKVPNKLETLRRHNVLLITDPALDEKFSPIEGAYDALHTSSRNELADLLSEKSVRGFLDFELECNEVTLPQAEEELKGRDYRATRKPRTATHEDMQAYVDAATSLAEFAEEFAPSIIYAPARGANPITRAMLWSGVKPTRVYFPISSSFVKHGRFNNLREASWLTKKFDVNSSKERVLYVEEVVSGGMMLGHLRELCATFQDSSVPIKVKSVGMVHAQGKKLDPSVERILGSLENEEMLLLRRVQNLFTLDDNEWLGLHYLDYSLGPHLVPYLPDGNTHPKSKEIKQFKRNKKT